MRLSALAMGGIALTLASQTAQAQSAHAYQNANCNASFLQNCDNAPNGGANSNQVSSAPDEALGSAAALGALGLALWFRRRTKRD